MVLCTKQNAKKLVNLVFTFAYNIVVAIKKFKESDEDEIAKKTIMREVRMSYLTFFSKGRLYLVFEYIEKNLLEVLEENTVGIDPKRLRYFVY